MINKRSSFETRRSGKNLIVFAACALVFVACSSDGSQPTTTTAAQPVSTTLATTTTTEATTTTQATSTTAEVAATTLPASPVAATLGDNSNNIYKVDLATGPVPFEDSELPAVPGQVQVSWYTYNGRFIVAFVGLETTSDLCPGASILTQNGFEFVSNAPTTGDCEGFATLTDDPLVEARVCQEVLLYATLIPSDQTGVLFGTLEALAEPGVVVGLTSQSDSSAGAPPLDLDSFCS